MKKAINQRAFPEEMGIEKCLKLAKNAGFEGFKINIDEDGQITQNSDEKAIKKIREFADKLGIVLTSFATKELFLNILLLIGYPEHWIQILGQRIRRVHLKYFRASAGSLQNYRSAYVSLLEGDVNWPKVIKALKQFG